MKKSNDRIIWIDALRAFACICVLFVHSPGEYTTQNDKFIVAPLTFFCMASGICVFFMISGALLFSKAQSLITFYKRRFVRIIIPTLIWSIIYIFFDSILKKGETNYLEKILLIPFLYQTPLLWFVYALLGIYLITPIVSTWLSTASEKDVRYILYLWGVTLIIPFLSTYHTDINKVVQINGPLNYFYGFIGYALLGYYLMKYVEIKILSVKFLTLSIIAFLLPLIVFKTDFFPVSTLITCQNLCSAMLASVVFLFFKDLDFKDNEFLKFILLFSEYSFGIYLCHIIFMKPFKIWVAQFHLNYLIQIPLTAIVTGIISLLFVWGLSKLPKSKLFIG